MEAYCRHAIRNVRPCLRCYRHRVSCHHFGAPHKLRVSYADPQTPHIDKTTFATLWAQSIRSPAIGCRGTQFLPLCTQLPRFFDAAETIRLPYRLGDALKKKGVDFIFSCRQPCRIFPRYMPSMCHLWLQHCT